MEINLQTYLDKQFEITREDHLRLESKVDKALEQVANHETRLALVEDSRKMFRRATGALSAAVIAGIVDLIINHVPKWFKP